MSGYIIWILLLSIYNVVMFYGKEYLYKTISQLKEAIIRYIEYYNKERIVVKLGMSPYRYRLSLQNNCNLV